MKHKVLAAIVLCAGLGGLARADPVPMPRRLAKDCTVAKQQKAAETCTACTRPRDKPEQCAEQKSKVGFAHRCDGLCSGGTCVEIWCKAKAPQGKAKD